MLACTKHDKILQGVALGFQIDGAKKSTLAKLTMYYKVSIRLSEWALLSINGCWIQLYRLEMAPLLYKYY